MSGSTIFFGVHTDTALTWGSMTNTFTKKNHYGSTYFAQSEMISFNAPANNELLYTFKYMNNVIGLVSVYSSATFSPVYYTRITSTTGDVHQAKSSFMYHTDSTTFFATVNIAGKQRDCKAGPSFESASVMRDSKLRCRCWF